LLAFNDADETGAYGHAGEGGLIDEQEDIDGVTVRRDGAGQKTEVVGETHAGWKDRLDRGDLLVGIECKLVAAALGCFDDDLEETVLPIDWFEPGGIGQARGRFLCHFLTPCNLALNKKASSNYLRERKMTLLTAIVLAFEMEGGQRGRPARVDLRRNLQGGERCAQKVASGCAEEG
jgi:hypothetical protein